MGRENYRRRHRHCCCSDVDSAFTVTVLRDRPDLAAVASEWEDLARNAAEPNAFYRPGAVLRALDAQDGGEGIRFVLVWIDDAMQGARKLGALFPFRGPALYKGLPVVALKSHRHARQRFCTPLVRKRWAPECFHALLDWFRTDGEGASLLELRALRCHGPVYRAFAEVARQRNQLVLASPLRERSRTLLVGDSAWGELAMATLPVLRWAKRSVANALYVTRAIRR
jgi:hypothetical protein